MSRIKEITVDFHATVSLGNFESFKIGYSETVEITRDGNPIEERARAVRRVKKFVESEISKTKREIDSNRPRTSNRK